MTNTTVPQWEERFDEYVKHTDSDKSFFPFAGDHYDFSDENCKKFIRQAIQEERQRIVEMIESTQGGFMIEGPFSNYKQGFFKEDIINLIHKE